MIASPEIRPERANLHGNDLLASERYRRGQEKSGSREKRDGKGLHERMASVLAMDRVSSP